MLHYRLNAKTAALPSQRGLSRQRLGIPDAETLANVWISAFGCTWYTNNTREEKSERVKRQIGVTPAVHTFSRGESRHFQLWHVVSLLLISIPAHG